MYNKCDDCVSDKSWCAECRDNPEVQKILALLPKKSCYMNYVPVCPRGYADCVRDPAYIKHYYPEWYKKLYGDMTPLDAIWVENGCMKRFEEDPNEKDYCYDDEDK